MTTLRYRHSVATGAVLLLGVYVFHDIVIYRDYVLGGEEPAFFGATLISPSSWLTRGYLNYFQVYPEWSTWYTSPFLRPVSNAVGYLNYTLFGSNFALHFAVYFLIQFLGLLLFVRILFHLSIPPLPAAGMALLFLFNPAFMNTGITNCLHCQYDVVAGVLNLAAFLAAWRERYGIALVLLTLAAFTKESAVFAPLAAALSLVIWRRPPIMSVFMVLPLVLWVAARFLAYGDVLDNGGPQRSGIAAGLSVWPAGLGAVDLFGSLPSNRTAILAALFSVANIGLWVFLGYAALTAARQRIASPERADVTTGLLVWTLGALAFGLLGGDGPRYGGSIYPFLYLLLAAFFFSPTYRVPRWAAASVLLVFSAATILQSARSARFAVAWQSTMASDRVFYDALRALPQDGRTVYVVNAGLRVVSAPQYLRRAWSLNLDVVIINNFLGCTSSSDAGSTQFIDSGTDVLSVRIPDCALFTFATASPDISSDSTGVVFRRNGIGTYRFPGGVPPSGLSYAGLGRTLRLQLDPKERDLTLIGYNWVSQDYHVINPP